ncbi:MAG TPA: FHA domain-containing protein [Myxococcaceae bacterium]|nr:FHA domain-containing protein [Myxococcaceae bacterium]
MFSVKEMRNLAMGLSLEAFRKQLGPFALIQKPEDAGPIKTQMMGSDRTMMARPDQISQGALALLFGFEDLTVATLPPMEVVNELVVGRLPDCDLVLDEPSVSKRHAELRWDTVHRRCILTELGSTNGTYLNAARIKQREVVLKDGDIVSFGEAQFWFVLTETLYSRLGEHSGSRKLRSRSG